MRASDTVRERANVSAWSVEPQCDSSCSSSRRDSRAGSSGSAVRADLSVKVAETEDTWFTERMKRWIQGRIECQWSADWSMIVKHLLVCLKNTDER